MDNIDTNLNTSQITSQITSQNISQNTSQITQATRKSKYSLDFSISLASDRTKFVENIIKTVGENNITNNDFELFTNYICCGLEEGEEKSPVQKKEIELEGPTKPKRKKEESLDALLESPTFNESTAFKNRTQYKVPRPSFSRSSIEAKGFQSYFKSLWGEIDQIARLIAIKQGKEVVPPPSFQEKEKVLALSSYKLYQLKKLLIELRRQQYTIRDFCVQEITPGLVVQSTYRGGEEETNSLGSIYKILPLGLYQRNSIFLQPYLQQKLPAYLQEEQSSFSDLSVGEGGQEPQDSNTTLRGQHPIIGSYDSMPARLEVCIDFRDPSHVYQLIEFREDLEESALGDPESTIPQLYKTLDYYTEKANLSEEQQEILKLKSLHYTNQFIQKYVNKKYSKLHSESYISTIYTRNICTGIARAATLHYDTFNARGIPSKFKQCKDCGEILLKDTRNFTRSARLRDGYQCRCKKCEKIKNSKN